MKFVKTFLIGMASISLVACSGGIQGTAVSKEKFNEEISKLEARSYTKATVKYLVEEKYSEGAGENKKAQGTATYSFNEGGFTLDANQEVSEEFEPEKYIGARVDEMIDGIPEQYNPKFYTGPLGVSFKSEQKGNEEGYSYSMSNSGYFQFNEFGYFIKGSLTLKSSSSGTVSGVKFKETAHTYSEITISYQ